MEYKTIRLDKKEQYTVITIDSSKYNAIDQNLIEELGYVFQTLDKDDSNNGIVLTGKPNCFSSGVAYFNLAIGSEEERIEFWKSFIKTLQAMVRYSKPFVCAITGNAPAGATILSLCADYRIMGKGAKNEVGLNEFKWKLHAPEIIYDIYAYALGEKNAWKAVQGIQLFNSEEALAIGLVDESVEVEEVLVRSEKYIQKLCEIKPYIFRKSKAYCRKDLLAIVDRNVDLMVDEIAHNMLEMVK